MPLSTTSALTGLAATVLPILACLWAIRNGKSRVYIILLTTVVAMAGALLASIPLMQVATQTGGGIDNVPYVLGSFMLSGAITGAVVGIAGVVLHMFGEKRRQPASVTGIGKR